MAQFAASGLTMREFCERNDVSATTLSKWKRRRRRKPVAEPEFVELPTMPMPVKPEGEFVCELALCDGGTLRLRRGFDPREVAELVRALR